MPRWQNKTEGRLLCCALRSGSILETFVSLFDLLPLLETLTVKETGAEERSPSSVFLKDNFSWHVESLPWLRYPGSQTPGLINTCLHGDFNSRDLSWNLLIRLITPTIICNQWWPVSFAHSLMRLRPQAFVCTCVWCVFKVVKGTADAPLMDYHRSERKTFQLYPTCWHLMSLICLSFFSFSTCLPLFQLTSNHPTCWIPSLRKNVRQCLCSTCVFCLSASILTTLSGSCWCRWIMGLHEVTLRT